MKPRAGGTQDRSGGQNIFVRAVQITARALKLQRSREHSQAGDAVVVRAPMADGHFAIRNKKRPPLASMERREDEKRLYL